MSSPLKTVLSGTQNPTSVATFGNRGDLFVRTGATPGLFQKITTDANDTNWQAVGGGSGQSLYSARYSCTSNVTIPTTVPTIVDFQGLSTNDWDDMGITGAITTGAAWNFTAAVACVVYVTCKLQFDLINLAGGENFYMQLNLNGTIDKYLVNDYLVPAGNDYVGITGTIPIKMAVNDYISVLAYTDYSGGATVLGAPDQTWISLMAWA